MSKKLLIACYFFPPCPSIGGRRSAKFAKYLAKQGDEIHVIQAINPFPTTSPWLKDILTEKNIHRYELPLHYPKEFIIPPKGLIGKLKYRIYNYYFKLFLPNKNKYDYTIYWEKAFLDKAKEILKKYQIRNILISGPPFYYAHQATKLKLIFPDLNIIVDFRDPWIGSPYYGMSSLKPNQLAFEIELMNDVYRKANYFIGPNTYLLNEQLTFIRKENLTKNKLVEIPHGYDLEELKYYMNTSSGIDSGKIKLVYGGQLYPGVEDLLELFSKSLSSLKQLNRQLYDKLEINFYTPEVHLNHYFNTHQSIVRFHQPVGNEIMLKIAEANICLIFLAEHNKNYRTTKFLEYSVLRKPFIVIGPKGYVAQFVEENKLGKSFDKNNFYDFESFLTDFFRYRETEYNSEFDFSEYEFEKISSKLRTLLH